MWKNCYKDFKQDGAWMQEKVETQKGIQGCEMHEVNGWGEKYHRQPKQKPGILSRSLGLVKKVFKKRKNHRVR